MKRLLCLLLGILFVATFAIGAMAEDAVQLGDVAGLEEVPAETPEAGTDDPAAPEEEAGLTQEQIDSYVGELRQSVQSQLAVADMALSLARTPTEETAPAPDGTVPEEPVDGEVPAETEEEDVMDPAKAMELAERHAFIAYAHLTGIPASRKLQENLPEFQDLWSGVVAGDLTVSQAFAEASLEVSTEKGKGAKVGLGKGTASCNPALVAKEAKVQQKSSAQAQKSTGVGQAADSGKSEGHASNGGGNGNGNSGGNNGGGNGKK